MGVAGIKNGRHQILSEVANEPLDLFIDPCFVAQKKKIILIY